MTCDDKSVEHNHNTTKDLRDIPTTLKAAGESNFKLVIYRTPHGKKIKKIDFSSVSASLSSRCQNPQTVFLHGATLFGQGVIFGLLSARETPRSVARDIQGEAANEKF